MRQIFTYYTLFFVIIFTGCKTNNMSGVYVCDQSLKKADTTIFHDGTVESYPDWSCIIEEIDFKGNSTIELKRKDNIFVTSYIVDKEYVRVKGTGGDILFKVQDNKTLIGQGTFQGMYHKK